MFKNTKLKNFWSNIYIITNIIVNTDNNIKKCPGLQFDISLYISVNVKRFSICCVLVILIYRTYADYCSMHVADSGVHDLFLTYAEL